MKYGTADIVMIAGETFTKTFVREVDGVAQSWLGRTTRLQMRHIYTQELLIELSAFLVVGGTGSTLLELIVPASFTTKMQKEGAWDLLSTSQADLDDVFRLPVPAGRILVLQGVTRG